MKTSIETYLPIFPGFYGTIFEPDTLYETDRINELREDKGLEGITDCEIEFDYKEYERATAMECIGWAERELKTITPSIEISFQKVVNPREYNFRNDSINVEIKLDKTELLTYLKAEREQFNPWLKDRYTSVSGFISSHSIFADEWIQALVNEDNKIGHKLGAMLEFLLTNEDLSYEDMYYDCTESIIALNYDDLT